MAFVLKDRVRETSTTTGTVNFTLLGAVTGFQPFSVFGSGNDFYYTIAMGAEWEVGIGVWNTSNQLERTTILASSNSNARVNFSSGTKDVFATFPAEGFAIPPPIGGTTPNTITGTTVTVNNQELFYNSAVPSNDGNGVIECVDDGLGDSYNDLRIYVIDQYGVKYAPFFPGGIAAANIVVRSQDWATNYQYVNIQVPSGMSAYYTLTLPSTAGSNNQVLKTDGSGNLSWLDFGSPPAIGGTTPNTGKFTTVQSTVATGTAPFTVASTTNVANLNASSLNGATFAAPGAIGSGTASTGAFTTITRSSTETITAISDPSAPSNGNVAFYAKTTAGYSTLAARNALNTSFGLQSALWSKMFTLWTTSSVTAGTWLNSSGSTSGTFTNVNPTVGSTLYQACRRSTYANVITTTNQILGVANGQACFFRGSVAGQGGFFYYARIGFDVWTNGGRFFAGMATGTGVVGSGDPSALNNTVGFCVDAADNGAISFLTRGTAATKASTGLTIVSNKGYDCYFYCSPNSSQYTWQIIDINTGTSASGTATANLPTNTTLQAPEALASNAALTTATAISIGVCKVYVESDN